jgi:hypothetical protein
VKEFRKNRKKNSPPCGFGLHRQTKGEVNGNENALTKLESGRRRKIHKTGVRARFIVEKKKKYKDFPFETEENEEKKSSQARQK